jgi:phosphatidylserine/phosphatidylglycerophosphate/cardiolipin synthase-like enzyme
MRLNALTLVLCTLTVMGCGPLPAEDAVNDLDVGVVQAGVSSASGTVGGRPFWAHFSNPPAFGGRDNTIITELRRLIDSTPAGATIRGAIHSINIDGVADSLLAAQNRGVTVYVVLDGKSASSTAPAVATIRSLTNHRFCTNSNGGGGCIGTGAAGRMHSTMFTFSQTKEPNGIARSSVAWFGSSDLSYATGPDAFNSTITVYEAGTLFDGLNANFSDMWNRRHFASNDYYDPATGRGSYGFIAADAYASPEAVGQTDTLVTALNELTPDWYCQMSIAMASVADRPEILAQLKRFRTGGCIISMVVGGDATNGISMPQTTYNALLDAGISIRRKDKLHDKFVVAYGRYGTGYSYRVHTGSQTWSQNALHENDELFFKMAYENASRGGTALYDGFRAHFYDAYNTAVACSKSNYPCK